MGGGSHQAEVCSGSGGGSAQTIAGEHGYPGSGSSSSSGSSNGGKVAATSGSRDTDSPACARDSTRACGIRKFAHIVPLGTADIGTAASAETHQAGLEWHCVFLMRKGGHSATRCLVLDESFLFMLPGWRAETTPGGFIMISPHVAAERRPAENGD